MPVSYVAIPTALALVTLATAAEQTFGIEGRILPATHASVSLHGATTPFGTSTLSDSQGRFRFTRIRAGQYTLSAFAPAYGERRTTLDVGPSSVDSKGRFSVTITMDDAVPPSATATVSAAELAVPRRARREYANAQKRLGRHDIEGAIAKLERAVDIAPRFAGAWNNLGTIAYQTQRYEDAERYFRKALEADADAYEPLVNLGGVLLNLGRPDEAYHYNLHAVLKRPADALANSQLGMTYFALGKADLAEKYLLEACRIDPGHFSYPQLLLAEIYVRREDAERAAGVLEEFVRYHPDATVSPRLREEIERLRRRD